MMNDERIKGSAIMQEIFHLLT